MLCAIHHLGVKALTILTVDIALNSRKVTQYQAKHVNLALKWEIESSFRICFRKPEPVRGQMVGQAGQKDGVR